MSIVSLRPETSPARWFAVGHSTDPDGRRAGTAAAEAALTGDDPRLLVVFCCDRYDIGAVLSGIRDRAGDVPLVGCSTAGEISGGGPEDASAVVVALGGPGFSVASAAVEADPDRLRDAGAEVAACLDRVEERDHRLLLLLTDGLAGDQLEFVRGAYRVLGAEVPLVGGCAGDGLRMRRTFQMHGDRVLTHSVVGAAIASDGPMGIGVRHGWRRVGAPMLVTASHGNRVDSLDDAPALDVYLSRLGAPEEAWSDAEAFTRFALTHPLGLSRRSGEEVRFVAGADFVQRSLACVAQVPQGGMTFFMEGDERSVFEATDAACQDALRPLKGEPALGLMAFDCIARRGVLGEEGIRHEVRQISRHAAGAPVAGFYTYGEFARTQGISGFHNETLVVLALG